MVYDEFEMRNNFKSSKLTTLLKIRWNFKDFILYVRLILRFENEKIEIISVNADTKIMLSTNEIKSKVWRILQKSIIFNDMIMHDWLNINNFTLYQCIIVKLYDIFGKDDIWLACFEKKRV